MTRWQTLGLILGWLGGTAGASAAQPVVVELFTSQGCSSCPPANANLSLLADRPDVLALNFGVTYWDDLGWKDTFAQPRFTERQRVYERRLGHSSVFTPQIVVDGSRDTVGNDRRAIERLIDVGSTRKGPEIALRPDGVTVAAGDGPAADVWLVRYDPRVIEVPVARGENAGVTLPHRNVVKSLERIGEWHGAATQFALAPPEAGLATAILVQEPNGGPILAAAKG